jgi:hypothetical protein
MQLNNTRTILSLDPSKTATGWAVLCGPKIIAHGCIAFKPKLKRRIGRKKNPQWNVVDAHIEFFDFYVNTIDDLVRGYLVHEVCAEFPHGSQSAASATALQQVKDIINSVCHFRQVPVHFYTESTCKKHYYGKSKGIEKNMTVDEMSISWADNGYKKSNVKYVDEAVCDSLLVLHKHLDL